MRKRIIGLAVCASLFAVLLQADDKAGAGKGKQREAADRAAESELKKSEKPPTAADEPKTTGSLEGVWRIVSINGNRPGGEFVKPPYDEYKIMTAGHYCWLSYDPATGKVLRSGGGTYSLDGENYTAHVDYSNAKDLRAVKDLEYKGTCRIEGNLWYHYGKMTNGAAFDELWERVH